MKTCVGIAVRALVLLLLWSSLGLGLNLISSSSIPWVYVYDPQPDLTIEDVKVRLIDEKEAITYFEDPGTTFVDTRKAEHYAEGHVKGAVCLPRGEKEDRFPVVQPLLPEENRLILYCYGPECEDAERVAEFLVGLGYKSLMIMGPGFPQWKLAGYPTSSRSSDQNSRTEDEASLGGDQRATNRQ